VLYLPAEKIRKVHAGKLGAPLIIHTLRARMSTSFRQFSFAEARSAVQ
jgi:hypothetical protein